MTQHFQVRDVCDVNVMTQHIFFDDDRKNLVTVKNDKNVPDETDVVTER